MMNIDLKTRVIDLTLGELLEVVKQQQLELQENQELTRTTTSIGEKYVYGLDGLARLLNCCKSTALKLKTSGKIDKAIIQDGRKIVIDAEHALRLIKDQML